MSETNVHSSLRITRSSPKVFRIAYRHSLMHAESILPLRSQRNGQSICVCKLENCKYNASQKRAVLYSIHARNRCAKKSFNMTYPKYSSIPSRKLFYICCMHACAYTCIQYIYIYHVHIYIYIYTLMYMFS